MLEALLPESAAGLRVEQLTTSGDAWTIVVATTAATAPCPICCCASSHVHSHYQRTLLDLPLATHSVRLQLYVRRFRCRTVQCLRGIFTERLPGLTRPYAHRTSRLAAALAQIGLALGGEAGVRLADQLHLPASPATLLRLVRALPDEPLGAAPRILGIDDWALRKGQRYGTILVDLQTGQVVDLLPDREAATVAAWLAQHPGAEIISRDRAGAYAAAATLGAPQARQVADRFHILQNLGEALEDLLARLYTQLRQLGPAPDAPPQFLETGVAADRPAEPAASTAVASAAPAEVAGSSRTPAPALPAGATAPVAPLSSAGAPEPGARPQRRGVARREARRAARQARYEEVQRLHALGWTQQAIGAQLDLSSKTIRRWLRAPRFPERRPRPPQRRPLDFYKAYLHERWQQGCHNAAQLGRELRAQGYRVCLTTVRDYLAQLRQPSAPASAPPADGVPPAPLPRPRQLRWLLWRPAQELKGDEYQAVQRVCAASQEVTFAYGLVTDFQTLVRNRQADQLASWVRLALASGVAELGSFARGVLRDFAAVLAGLELDWNQGAVEGNVNRLKMLKRQMYGRAKFDLLRLRVLYAH